MAGTSNTIVVHQLDKDGKCWREFTYSRVSGVETDALLGRIKDGYNMNRTGVTINGEHQLGMGPESKHDG